MPDFDACTIHHGMCDGGCVDLRQGNGCRGATGTAVAKAKPATAVRRWMMGLCNHRRWKNIHHYQRGVASNGASEPTVFSIDESWLVTEIKTIIGTMARGASRQHWPDRRDGTTYALAGYWFPGQAAWRMPTGWSVRRLSFPPAATPWWIRTLLPGRKMMRIRRMGMTWAWDAPGNP